MKYRLCIEISDGPSADCCFVYFDTVDNLADFLFDHMNIEVEREMEFRYHDDDPFKMVMCRIPIRQREAFLEAVEVLPGLMAYADKAGYKEYCLDVMKVISEKYQRRYSAESKTLLQ